ncbi:hypothetical protein M3Y98_00377200 [Aphelenchoides besseyi]|nr:hypothetical protein M3Y98_00377200 [Aphelenchoides besseyi]KAI6201876.1 hypothetical protein M3Y96_00888800 [Aphelenchoides besseyi]
MNFGNMDIPRLGILFLIFDFGLCRHLSREECLSLERSNFMQRTSKVVSVVENEPAYLHCTVPHSANNLVAWTRLTDDALLTAGGQSFTSDTRFQISPKREARDWILNIRRVQLSDSGCYLCEVNTDPQTSLFTVYLNVIAQPEVTTQLSAAPKRTSKIRARMDRGSLIVNCTVESDRYSAVDVLWTHNGKLIDVFDEKKYTTTYKIHGKTIIYTLRIADATSEDNGSYACQGDDLPEASEIVSVNLAAHSKVTLLNLFVCTTLMQIFF